MEIKVRAVETGEPKGVQEVEKELLEKHEQSLKDADEAAAAAAAQQSQDDDGQDGGQMGGQDGGQDDGGSDEIDLDEKKVLSYIEKRYNKQINSFEELVAERKGGEDVPADVAAYLKYRKETGRGFEDFLKLNKDYESMDPDQILRNYLTATQQGLDDEDIDILMDDYKYDEDIDDESRVKKVKIAKKKAVAEARKFFNEQKEKYKVPLESSTASIPDAEKQEFEAYKQYVKQAKTQQEEAERKSKWFQQKTDEVFSSEFKGFEFKLNDKTFKFAPGDATELKKSQLSPMSFIGKFLDENGLMKDAAGYHRSLSIAMNPERFAKFFYEQGMSDATESSMRKIKNINMSDRKTPEVINKGGVQVKAVDAGNGRNLKIRSIKKA